MLNFLKINVRKVKENSNKETKIYTPGNVRLSMGLYYTEEEKLEYIKKSLKRKLP